jgi:hypothetical protein
VIEVVNEVRTATVDHSQSMRFVDYKFMSDGERSRKDTGHNTLIIAKEEYT